MATNTGIAPPSLSEDSVTRFGPLFSLPRRFLKRTYTLVDGTNVGGTTDYVMEVVALDSSTLAPGAGSAATDITASATGAASAITATLPAVAGKTTYLTGFEVTGAGATAGSVVTVTVTGTVSGTLSYKLTVPAGASVGVTPLQVEFSRPIPASAVNTALVVNVPSLGAGNTDAAVVAHGFQQ